VTHVTDERKAQLDAAAEERAAFLEEVKHPVAGVHVQSLIDEPESYHAGQLTPAYHVPGNIAFVEKQITVDQIPVEILDSRPTPVKYYPELGVGALPKGVESIKSTGIFAEPSAPDLDAVAAEESAQEATQGEQSDPTPNSGETTLSTDPLPEVLSNTSSETEQSNG
jgi:hypothetical protein